MVQTGGNNTDQSNLWVDVGELEPQFTTWQKVGILHEVISGIYRLIYTCPNFTLVDSYGLLRVFHVVGGDKVVSPCRRIYPKPERYQVKYYLPDAYKLAGVENQCFELKRILDRWQYRADAQPWSIKIQQLNVQGELSKTSFYLVLENLSIATDPTNNDFYISTFIERVSHKGRDLREYNVGRFYVISTGEVYSDGFIEKQPYELRVTFTSRAPIQPGQLKVEISY